MRSPTRLPASDPGSIPRPNTRATVQSTWPSDMCTARVGIDEGAGGDDARAGGAGGGEAEQQDEHRHEEHATAVGEQAAQHTDGEGGHDHERGALPPGGRPDGVVGGIGKQHAGADDEEEHARSRRSSA